jgi:hypothetical protein
VTPQTVPLFTGTCRGCGTKLVNVMGERAYHPAETYPAAQFPDGCPELIDPEHGLDVAATAAAEWTIFELAPGEELTGPVERPTPFVDTTDAEPSTDSSDFKDTSTFGENF